MVVEVEGASAQVFITDQLTRGAVDALAARLGTACQGCSARAILSVVVVTELLHIGLLSAEDVCVVGHVVILWIDEAWTEWTLEQLFLHWADNLDVRAFIG